MRRVAMVGAGMTDFGELFELGIKDMVPMAVTEAVDSVDKGFDRADIQAAWFGELVTTDGFADRHPRRLVRPARHPGLARSRTPAPPATTPSATGRWRSPAACTTWCSWSAPTRSARPSTRGTFWDWMGMTRDMAWDFPLGLVAPANFALHAARYLHESPTRPASTWRWWR